jgi:ABC-type multidrug transport system ATPase subunit/ABC-type multidrug transport system permease subunit
MQAHEVAVRIGDRTILQPTSLDLQAGRLVALIGPSGGGKSTLLRVLAGELVPSEGSVTIGDVPLARRTDAVGYVPFGDLLHGRLSVREALGYVAALRALPDADDAERRARVDTVLSELSLSDRGDSRIQSLSGGERRRAAVGVELLGHPSVLLLDEPATGLDARLERRLMELLRELADDGRAVMVVTHATASLELCDDIAVMGPDGALRFYGSPAELLERFDVPAYERVYEALDVEPAGPAPVVTTGRVGGGGAALAPERMASLPGQAAILASRYFKTLTRDRRTLALLIGQAPVIGAAIGLVLPREVLNENVIAGYYGVMLAYLVTVGSLWLGVTSSCREVVKEQQIVMREAATGVRLDAYLFAKCIVLFPLAALQSVLLMLVVALLQPLNVSAAEFGQMLGLCVLTAWSSVALGLWVSAMSRSADQASSAIPLILIPQLLLAGAVIPIAKMIGVMKGVSVLALSRWSFNGLGTSLGLDTKLSADIGAVTGYSPAFFDRSAAEPVLALVVFILAGLVGTAIVLDRRIGRTEGGIVPEGR